MGSKIFDPTIKFLKIPKYRMKIPGDDLNCSFYDF